MKKIKILLTGGGSGGHIYPLAAVARELQKAGAVRGYEADIRYFGDPGVHRFALEAVQVRITRITASKWRRYVDLQNILDIFKFAFSVLQGLWKVYWFMPHVCFSKGGPGSFAVIAVCRFYAIPTVIHESDAALGLANKLAARYARLVELGFASAQEQLDEKVKAHVVGNPVRPEITAVRESIADAPYAKAEFGFSPQEPVVLFIGGSQGAEALNGFVLENIRALTDHVQVLHQVGIQNFAAYRQEFDFANPLPKETRYRYAFVPYFSNNIAKAYQASDIVVARSSAGVIAEIAALAKPSLLVPIPGSANDHQQYNAYEYALSGAAVVIEQENLLVSIVINEITHILGDQTRYLAMADAAQKFYNPESAQLIASDIFTIAGA